MRIDEAKLMDLNSHCDLDSQKKEIDGEALMKSILEKANLSQYYEAFISHGGDDVNQLCEAGEEEFLEIMALVGMAMKPLHVRRLQKVLHEWILSPDSMKNSVAAKRTAHAPGSIASLANAQTTQPSPKVQHSPNHQLLNNISDIQPSNYPSFLHQFNLPTSYYDALLNSSRASDMGLGLGCNSYSDVLARYNDLAASSRLNNISNYVSDRSNNISKNQDSSYPYVGKISPASEISDNDGDVSTNGHVTYSLSEYPLYPPGSHLLESHMMIIESVVSEYASTLPMYAPKPLNMKKPVDREIEETMTIGLDDPCRLDVFRKYSAIYGRFDSKRNKEKHMNFHEMCVNEAAAQLCLHRPALLTRREDLFFQARQVVKMAASQLKGHQRKDEASEYDGVKRIKTEPSEAMIHEKPWRSTSNNGHNLSTNGSRSDDRRLQHYAADKHESSLVASFND